MDKSKYYDEILAKIYENILVEHSRDEGLYINGYHDNYACKVYMQMVNAVADITDTPVIMVMDLFSYIKFKLKNWKVRKRYRRANLSLLTARWCVTTPIEEIAEFVANYYNESMKIYEDIYKEFYE